MLDLESNVSNFKVAGRCRFLMEGISARCQVDVLRLISLRSPAFNSLTLRLVAFENLNLSASNLSTAEVDLTEGHLTWKIIVLIRYCNS